MKSLKQSVFSDHTDEEIKNWLDSPEHYWFIKGGKEGIWLGVILSIIPWITVGVLIAELLI
ncbi:MAG: hypothetical protein M0P49_00735 [Bacilli bacterium]|jgi:hypothetical protein|nr:hypothetical protein [Bacilli bacterium]